MSPTEEWASDLKPERDDWFELHDSITRRSQWIGCHCFALILLYSNRWIYFVNILRRWKFIGWDSFDVSLLLNIHDEQIFSIIVPCRHGFIWWSCWNHPKGFLCNVHRIGNSSMFKRRFIDILPFLSRLLLTFVIHPNSFTFYSSSRHQRATRTTFLINNWNYNHSNQIESTSRVCYFRRFKWKSRKSNVAKQWERFFSNERQVQTTVSIWSFRSWREICLHLSTSDVSQTDR